MRVPSIRVRVTVRVWLLHPHEVSFKLHDTTLESMMLCKELFGTQRGSLSALDPSFQDVVVEHALPCRLH